MHGLAHGDQAPAFRAPDQTGAFRSLEDFAGKWLLLYFYPKDDTPGCTKEACGLRDAFAEYRKRGVEVVGVSCDSVKSHGKFAQKYELPFTLLADEDKAIVEAYGAWGEKSMYGKTYMGTFRMSYLIDPTGKIAKVYSKVKPELHAEEALNDLASLQ